MNTNPSLQHSTTASLLPEEQIKEFQAILGEIKGGWSRLRDLPELFNSFQSENESVRKDLAQVRRSMAARAALGSGVRAPGFVSDDCARHIAGIALVARLRSGKQIENAGLMQGLARDILGMEIKTALSSSDIPLPTEYSGQVVELVSQYGAARRFGTVYPLGGGTVKLPQLKTDTAFGLIAQSATITEKSPQTAWVTFAVEKYGGLIRVPSELDADSMDYVVSIHALPEVPYPELVPVLIELRRVLKPGGILRLCLPDLDKGIAAYQRNDSTYGAVEGLTKSVITNSKVTQMASTKTHCSDATLLNLRALRAVVDATAIATGAYYMHPSFEQFLSGLNTAGDKPYQANAAQGATLDGFPIRWVDVLPAYSTSVNASKVFMLFGDMSFQYLGVRGGVRFDTSVDAAFATDEILIRALERFTIGLMATGAVAGLETAAS